MSEETARIEADIDQSRHRLNDTLNAMGGKLSPGQIVDEVMGLAQGQAGQFTANLGRQVRDNPLPAVLIGAGIAALMMQGRQSRRAGFDMPDRASILESVRLRTVRRDDESDDAYDDRLHTAQAEALGLKQSTGEAVDAFKTRVRDTIRSMKDTVSDTQHRITDTVAGAAQFAGRQASQLSRSAGAATQGAKNLFEDNPLVGGAVAMALGAVLGALAPLTRMERDALSGVADNAADGVAAIANRGADAITAKTDAVH